VDFRLLGPFEVESDGRDLTPARRKQRLLLVALLLRAGRVVATDDLIDVVWGESAPATAQKALHGHVSALRKLLGAETIETRPPGYLLHVDEGSVDTGRFEALVEAAGREIDPATRRDLLRSASALFRGEPLADFRYEPFAREEAARLKELRLGALTGRIEAELELGRHGELIPELERVVAEHPHDERLRAALMLALYRGGRQAQALHVYGEGRQRLVEDLGIDPGPALQQLERRILNQDPALELPSVRAPAAEAPRTNLPQQPTPLIGREQELEEVRARLRNGGGRLWTLTGPAGTGKTRLAIEAAVGLPDRFPDGAFFVALAPMADPELVLPTIADTVGVDKGAGVNVADVVEQSLADRKLLLVLDNFEHLLTAAPAVSRLVGATNELVVLATSRERLHVGGERVYPVPPLSSDEAIALFAERAEAVKPDFQLTEANERVVAEICRRLDGLPLAIELAAARVALFPPVALLDRLDERLKLLTGGARDRPERHQTLRAAIDWSHDLLSEEDQTLLARLSVFAGGWTVEAAEAVCNSDLDVISGLSSLVDKNLVQLGGSEQEPRLTMLETIREYARERLEAGGETETRRRHAEYFLAFAEELEPALVGRGGREAQKRLFAELDNFRVALSWAVETGAGSLALSLVWALWRFWWDHSLAAESQTWCEAALAAAPDAPPELRGRALFAASDVFYVRGDWDEYRDALAEALPLLEAGHDEEFVLYTLWALSVVDHVQGDQDAADRRALDALVRAEAGGYDELIGRLNVLLGAGALMRGDAAAARVYFETAAAKHEQIGDSYGRAVALQNLGIAAVLGGEAATAARALVESLDEWDFSQNLHNLGHTLVVAAGIAHSYGEVALATRVLGMVAAHFERVGVLLQPFEAQIDRETRAAAEAELGTARYEQELSRGAAADPADELPTVREALRRWATAGHGARL
jgi:predicted ATPase/DNA-binding SARP family transcriptional activator